MSKLTRADLVFKCRQLERQKAFLERRLDVAERELERAEYENSLMTRRRTREHPAVMDSKYPG